jgi:acyl-CoA thioester hydrolase
MSQTHMTYLLEHGFDHRIIATYEFRLVVFYEHVYYFKKPFPVKPIMVSLEIMGISEDTKFFEFYHNVYNGKGENIACY